MKCNNKVAEKINLNSLSTSNLTSIYASNPSTNQDTNANDSLGLEDTINLIKKNFSNDIFPKLKALNEIIKKDDKCVISKYTSLDSLFQNLNNKGFNSNIENSLIAIFSSLANNRQIFSRESLDLVYEYILNKFSFTQRQASFEVCVGALDKILEMEDYRYILSESKINELSKLLCNQNFNCKTIVDPKNETVV